MDDTVYRQAVIDGVLELHTEHRVSWQDAVIDMVDALPSAQLDGIPLKWIDKHLEWLDNCDNDFAQLAKVSIRAMVEIWKKDKS